MWAMFHFNGPGLLRSSTTHFFKWALLLIPGFLMLQHTQASDSGVSILVNGTATTNAILTTGTDAIVSIQSTLPSPTIFYSLDGTEPTAGSTVYSTPFAVTNDLVVQALAIGNDFSRATSSPVSISFLSRFPLTVQVVGNGAITKSPDQPDYAPGDTVTLTATPAANYTFDTWNDGVRTASRTVTIRTGVNNYTATFITGLPLEDQVVVTGEEIIGGAAGDVASDIGWDGGGYVLWGVSASQPGRNKTAPLRNSIDFWAVRLASDFSISWDHSFTPPVSKSSDLTPRSGGGFYGIGENGSDAKVVGLDAAGNELFVHTWGGPGLEITAHMVGASDGGYVVAMRSDSGIGGTKGIATTGVWVFKANESGVKQWESAFHTSDYPELGRIIRTHDGYVIVGRDLANFGVSGLVLKIDSSGNEIWRIGAGTSVSIPGPVSDVIELPDGTLVCVTSGILTALSSDGHILWQKVTALSGSVSLLANTDGSFYALSQTTRLLYLTSGGDTIWDQTLLQNPAGNVARFVRGGTEFATAGTTKGTQGPVLDYWPLKFRVDQVPAGTPVITVDGGVREQYEVRNQFNYTLAISSSNPDAVIRYTTDGSDPESGAIYSGPVVLDQSATLRAVAVIGTNHLASRTVSVVFVPSFTLDLTSTVPGTAQPFPVLAAYASNTVVHLSTPLIGRTNNLRLNFLGWTGDVTSSSPEVDLVMNGNKQVRAVYGAAVTTSITGSGTISRYPGNGPYEYPTVVQLLAIPGPGYYFALWGGETNGTTGRLQFPIEHAWNISALFESTPAGKFTLTALPNGNGEIVSSIPGKYFDSGQTVTLRAEPSPGSSFLGWSGDVTTTDPEIAVTVNRQLILYANFTGGDPSLQTTGKISPVITWSNPAPITYGTPLSVTQLNATADVPGTFSYSPAAGTLVNAGTARPLTVTFTPSDTDTYENGAKTVFIDVAKAAPIISWSNPADIIEGTPLSEIQLNAAANVAGTFAYTPAAGTLLVQGPNQTITTVFTPTDTSNYLTATKSVQINVTPGSKQVPVIAWNHPADIQAGTPLGAGQLNATASVPGSFTYSPPAGTILTAGNDQMLTAVFTPADTEHYFNVTNHVFINVTPPVSPVAQEIAINSELIIRGSSAEAATDILSDPTGYTIWGSSVSGIGYNKTEPNIGANDFWVVHLSPDFVQTADYTFGSINEDISTDIVARNGGGYVGVGEWRGLNDTEVVAFDASGLEIFRKNFGGTGLEILPHIAPGHDSGYLLAMRSDSGIGGNKGVETLGVWFVKIDESGNKVWERAFSTSQFPQPKRLIRVNGGYVVVGTDLEAFDPAGLILKIDTEGNLLWRLGRATPTRLNPVSDIIELSNGNLVCLEPSVSGSRVTALTPDGGVVWQKSFPASAGAALSLLRGPAGVFYALSAGGEFLRFNSAGEITFGGQIPTTRTGFTRVTGGPESNGGAEIFAATGTSNDLMPDGTHQHYLATKFSLVTPGTPVITVENEHRETYTFTNQTTVLVTISSSAPDAEIRYSLDGSDPLGGTVYQSSIQVNQSATIRAVAITSQNGALFSAAIPVILSNNAPHTPVITWSAPADIVYGTPLGAVQLNASADAAGSFNYSPGSGTILPAGSSQITAVFTPADATQYYSATQSVTINVVKATPVVQWESPADIVEGTALGAQQLNATANQSGSFVYSPSAGTVLPAGSNQVLTVTFVPVDSSNFNPVSQSVTINVLRNITPVVTWGNPVDIVYGTALGFTQFNATANVPGTFTYSPGFGTVLNAGSSQPLMAVFHPSDTSLLTLTQSVSINVLKAPQEIQFTAPESAVVGDTINLSAVSSSGLPVSFDLVSGPASLAGQTLTITNSGTVTVRASQAGNGNVFPATPVGRAIVIAAPSLAIQIDGDAITLTLPQLGGYVLERSSDLTGAWTEVQVPQGTTTLSLPNNGQPGAAFYRLRALQNQ